MTKPAVQSEASVNISAGLQTNSTDEGSRDSGLEILVNCTTITQGVLEVRKGMRPLDFENG